MDPEAVSASITPSEPPAARTARVWRDMAENLLIISVASYAWLGANKLTTWEWFAVCAVVAGVAGVGPVLQRLSGGNGPRSLSGLLLVVSTMFKSMGKS